MILILPVTELKELWKGVKTNVWGSTDKKLVRCAL